VRLTTAERVAGLLGLIAASVPVVLLLGHVLGGR